MLHHAVVLGLTAAADKLAEHLDQAQTTKPSYTAFLNDLLRVEVDGIPDVQIPRLFWETTTSRVPTIGADRRTQGQRFRGARCGRDRSPSAGGAAP